MQLDVEHLIINEFRLKPFFLKHFPSDKLGHSDGVISFLDKHTVALSIYPEDRPYFRTEREYLNELKEELEYQRFKVVQIYDSPFDEKIKSDGDWLYSASGCYTNFLRLNDTIILPQFDMPKKEVYLDLNSYNKTILEQEGFKVITIQADDLYRLGGGLRCITWIY